MNPPENFVSRLNQLVEEIRSEIHGVTVTIHWARMDEPEPQEMDQERSI